jgi:hypothetical protein
MLEAIATVRAKLVEIGHGDLEYLRADTPRPTETEMDAVETKQKPAGRLGMFSLLESLRRVFH